MILRHFPKTTAAIRTITSKMTTRPSPPMKKGFIVTIDQGTSSTRVIIFNEKLEEMHRHQESFPQIRPQPGWLEHDPNVILKSVRTCLEAALKKLEKSGQSIDNVLGIGIANQRETTVVWHKKSGRPLYNAIVWADVRTKDVVEKLKAKTGAGSLARICGLSLSTYFSAVKLRWLLDNVEEVRSAYDSKQLMFGTIDSWLVWNLTGGVDGGLHITDSTNASRTMLVDIESLRYNDQLIEFFDLSNLIMPSIKSSSEVYGNVNYDILHGVPIAGILGDQSAALVGHLAFEKGEAKNTYGTGCFLLFNVGDKPTFSTNGLLTTVAYDMCGVRSYALEGSIAVAGSAISWARDQMGWIKDFHEVNELASKVSDTGGLVFITAFSGLYAPYWRDDVQGSLFGITSYTNRNHLARAILEATCFQTEAIIQAMKEDSGEELQALKVDGGMTESDICMQIQSDISGIKVSRQNKRESTALGSAIAASLGLGVYKDIGHISGSLDVPYGSFSPKIGVQERREKISLWDKAIEQATGWKKETS